MAPETAGPGDSLEWRSIEVAPKPQGLSARPLRRESGVPREPATSTLNTGIFARARTHTHTCTHPHVPNDHRFPRAHTLALTVKMHGLPRARGFTYTLQCRYPVFGCPLPCTQVWSRQSGGSAHLPFVPGAVPQDRSGWTLCPWLLDKPEIVCVSFRILLSTSLPSSPFPHSPFHCVSFLCIMLSSKPTLSLLVPFARARCLLPNHHATSPPLHLPLPQRCSEFWCALKNRSLATAARRAAATQPPATFSSAEHRGCR